MSADEMTLTFVVGDRGALSIQDMATPETRSDCLGIELGSDQSVREVMYFVDEGWRPKAVVAQAYLDKEQIESDPEDFDEDDLRSWLEDNPENIAFAYERLRIWLADTQLDDEDYDAADLLGNNPQSAAMRFWRDGDLNPRDFGIVIIEGEFSGSSYYAAELRKPIEYANAQAEKLGAAVRFVQTPEES
ncbi:MAG: hypothetical protein U1E51_16350 [Candidatus Binatia bacterium]|nr:hypothetical protein [Candidatus Binatia bacterium]